MDCPAPSPPRLTPVQCDQVADRLAEVACGELDLSGASHRHVEQCLRCQAELVQYRKLLRSLRSVRTEVLEPSPGLLAGVLASIEREAEHHAVRGLLHGRRVAYIGGLAAATAAGVGGALVIATRNRRRLLAS